MKSHISIFFLLLQIFLRAQNPVTEYYDKDFHQVRKEKAVYYRIISYDDSANPVGVVHDYYLSGKLQWEGHLNKQKQNEGWCVWYYENGQKAEETNAIDGYNVGPFKNWYESGQLMSEGNFVPGNGDERRGKWIYYWENGNIQLTANFTTNDKMDSVCTMYYENGKIEARGNYVNGFCQGVCEYYDVKGKRHLVMMNEGEDDIILVLKSVDFFIKMDQQRDGKNKKKKQSDSYYELHNYGLDTNFVNGKCQKKSADGKIVAEFTLVNDQMEGSFISYNKDGSKNEEGNYLHNLKEGGWKYYFENGSLYKEVSYMNGRENGIEKHFSNGIQNKEIIYVNGLRQGKSWRIETDDYTGKPEYREEFEFKNDTLDERGEYKMWYVDSLTLEKKGLMAEITNVKYFSLNTFYYENGKPQRIYHLDSTRRNGTFEIYFENGKMKTQGKLQNFQELILNSWDSTGKQFVTNGNGTLTESNYGNGKKTSQYENGYLVKQQTVDDSGKVLMTSTYKDGKKDGSEILYFQNGKKQQEVIYKDGVQIKVTTWYDNGNVKMEREDESALNGQNGSEIYYYENGQKQREDHSHNRNRKDSLAYDENGKLILKITYDEFGDELERKTY